MSLQSAFDLAVRTIDFKHPHPLHKHGDWRLLIRGPWQFREERVRWWAFAEPYNETGVGLDRTIEGYGSSLEEALLALVTAIHEVSDLGEGHGRAR